MKSSFQTQCKTRQEVANEYGITRRTLYNWFTSAGLKFDRKILTPRDLTIIYATFGNPRDLENFGGKV